MNNAKVTVTKEVAEAIELSVKNDISVRTMLRHNVHGDFYGVYAPLQTMHVEELAKALIIGYEIEKSPEDEVREYFVRNGPDYATTQFTSGLFEGRRQGIINTLYILGIKIEGVNA